MKRLLPIGLLAASVLAPCPAFAAADIFGQFTNINGESIQKGHENWIEVLSYSWGAANSGSSSVGGGAVTGKVEFEDFTFTKLYDVSSAKLLDSLAKGAHIQEGLFELTKISGAATPEVYLEYRFEDVFLTSYSIGGSSGGGTPLESWSFAFGKVETKYRPQDAKTGKLGAPVTFTWDLAKGGGGVTPAIPEPSTWAMFMAGLLVVVYFGRNRVREATA